ncbi:GDSL esterase/lipase At1g29670-like [Trifolium pratense]|uniref:GDSL esterase/lipase At1g29670-like n=1 Tax=Trifolium pratense TaxID=57577 RepID=UPI001E69451A|nr:GDSL esterase/lipase At1g29670-like [Trifolium pratense]
MDCEIKLWLVVIFLFSSAIYCVVGEPQVPCLFIFGDSLSDSGNNNNLNTDAKVNYMPYGIDFPGGPTGRFTNGRTSIDIISQILGFPNFIPPYANTEGADIVLGVNYASGAAGIRNETGTHLGPDISMGLQVQHHTDIVSQITEKLGSEKVQEHLNKCLYYVNIGSNDYLNNYFLPQFYPSNGKYTADQYAAALVKEHSTYLKALHELGARKFSLVGLGPLGCIPHEISTHGKNNSLCIKEENNAAQLFNDKLRALVDRFNKELPDAKFILIGGSKSNDVKLTDIAICCKVGSNGQCIPDEKPCRARDLHPFFDAFHPSEMVNKLSAETAYHAPSPSFAYPMDISHLVKL